MPRYRLSAQAEQDVLEILAYTERQFGAAARRRYETLLVTALRALAADPDRLGSVARPELGEGIRSYHLRHSRTQAARQSEKVRQPRHLVVYRRLPNGVIGVGRILHDGMELARHRPASYGEP